MGLKDTVKTMHQLLSCISQDLTKAERGNKTAGQRVRTATIELAKVSKVYRKESMMQIKRQPSKIRGRRSKPLSRGVAKPKSYRKKGSACKKS